MSQLGLFPAAPRPAPPLRQDKPKPAPCVPDTAAVKAREARILAALSGTLDDIPNRANADGMHLSQSATVCDLIFMTRDGLILATSDPEPVYRLP